MIITSLLDTDLYKFTMMQAVLHQFPGAQVDYKFKCRNPGIDPATGQAKHNLAAHVNEIRDEIRFLCSLHFQDAELIYLRSLRFIKSDFVDFLGLFKLNEKYISVTALPSGEIDITIRGPWLHTILFEIPVLAIVNEVYFRNTQQLPDLMEGRKRLDLKIAQLRGEGLHDLKIADYGTRRRFWSSAPMVKVPGQTVTNSMGVSSASRTVSRSGPPQRRGVPAKTLIPATSGGSCSAGSCASSTP